MFIAQVNDVYLNADDSWVKAEGVLKSYEEGGYQLSYIDLSSLDILIKRGAENVTQ